MSEQLRPALAKTIPGPLPPVPESLIRRRPVDAPAVEPNAFQRAVNSGDEGLVGVDGSGNDWEFPQNIGSIAVIETLFENQSAEEAKEQ